MEKQDKWVYSFGFINFWNDGDLRINLIPSLDYVDNEVSKNISLYLFGLGIFFGKVNMTLIEHMNNNG